MEVIEIVARVAARLGARAVFVGGVAVECYVPYRRTHDVDVVTRERDFATLKSLLVAEGFAHRRASHLDKHAFKARGGGQVDAYTSRVGDVAVDEGLFRRSRELAFGGTHVQAASIEDLIRLKLSAGREMDLADVAVLLHERGAEVDEEALESLVGSLPLREAGPRLPDMLPEEYGWQARRALKGWLRKRGWL
jgi:predicted nucleotidyltransferase